MRLSCEKKRTDCETEVIDNACEDRTRQAGCSPIKLADTRADSRHALSNRKSRRRRPRNNERLRGGIDCPMRSTKDVDIGYQSRAGQSTRPTSRAAESPDDEKKIYTAKWAHRHSGVTQSHGGFWQCAILGSFLTQRRSALLLQQKSAKTLDRND